MNRIVKLAGVSKKGRERIKQHGELWEVLETIPSERMLVRSVQTADWRWLEKGDLNFKIIQTESEGS